MAFNLTDSAADVIRGCFNGPPVAGIGATVDQGLVADKHHVVPWDTKSRYEMSFTEDPARLMRYSASGKKWLDAQPTEFGSVALGDALRYAIYNVDRVFGYADRAAAKPTVSDDDKDGLRRDLISILFVMVAGNYHLDESRESTPAEKSTIGAITVTNDFAEQVVNDAQLNRAYTFILCRMHTKYQTNHVLGGSPMQASMASAVRAFYGVPSNPPRATPAAAKLDLVAECMHWALHPANERFLIPQAINGTHMDEFPVPRGGPLPVLVSRDEYFTIRANTPPASTHMFYVCASAIRLLQPLGILPYLPQPSRIEDIKSGFLMIAAHGAKLHPAARYWGLERHTANQKLVEGLAADLGYAVRKLMRASSLAESPLLAREDLLNSQWKALIDALRVAMEEAGSQILETGVMDAIRRRIAPTAAEVPISSIEEVVGYLTAPPVAPSTAETSRAATPAAEEDIFGGNA